MYKLIATSAQALRCAFACACVLGAAAITLPMTAPAQPASESNAQYPPNTSGPKNIEGLWWPLQEFGPGPPGGDGAGPPPERPVELTGSTLQCAPVQRMNGGGGGMSTLIIQAPDQIVMISEEDMDIARKIYMGGKHPANIVPQPNGHSIGHWEGDTLVVDTVGYSDKNGKDKGEHVVERITKSGSLLLDDVTTTDKSGNTRKEKLRWAWRPDLQFNENVCEEGFERYQLIDGKLDNPNIPPDREKRK